MKVGVILVGTELLNGGMLDTNSLYIAEELNKYGLEMKFKITVRDFRDEIYSAIDYCKKNVDLIIISGGLGPTLDDITKEVIAEYVKKPLVVDDDELEELKEKFERAGLKFKTLNVKEVEKPEGAVTFKNDVGMAPAVYIDDIVAFPGVPKELYNMLPKFLDWYVKEKKILDDEIYIKDLITYGIAESLLYEAVREFFTEEGIYYEFLVKDYGILIRLQSKMSNKNKVEKIVKKIYNKIGEFIFGEDNDRLEKKVVELLKKLNMNISTAESCTGGMLASKLIDVPGISEVFYEGVVSYSNEAKINRLGVRKEILDKYGAVSEEVAKEMVMGLTTDVALSTTGIAGPDGGSEEKPVGLVYMGIRIKDKIYVEKRVFRGDRNKVRERTVSHTLFTLIKILNEDV
ncbi:MAG: CinA family nicotinamide mononucleotide deamidase-related protein [Fusobacterium mortiferum]|jgi:nicotinamide-nucleotide amidase|uniref:CinA family nicotinamide mononucleotide deamidase-related protein n=1 Tax=Fusobacterium TaxID=848 RepID=UPI000E479719|nr:MULTISPECIES: CinA family nicotinamide mononucleotide deamidase-related protein [Fusobacterium]MCF2700329.1 CinA family nicotinamide mononucleotide deamidase-related protein [Fusobacterium mortiferum]MCI7187900.1 CinA family nicotinamide mononucleotide deamidase-related protein [Fusobacterium mortiferum]MCI7665276.1 CinA family nicotinamide mononucleotide deamidase-related protein [Fusobacterium mortiferum]MDY2800910.1 CinA family nicotinamide mononucleotide deamidase-related protein [Fusoba